MYTTKAQICIRRDTAANFTSANPTLALGEIAYETDTRNIKVGNGSSAWTALPYINPFRGNAAADTTNTVLGSVAGASMQSGATYNTCIGSNAGNALTTADFNVFVGAQTGVAVTTGSQNVAVGYAAYQVGNGTSNTAVGMLSQLTATSGGANTSVGAGSLQSNLVGNNNVAVGANALNLNTASDITAVGANALDANTTGTSNVAVGKDALGANTTGSNNVAVGNNSLAACTTGYSNVCIGPNAGDNLTTGYENVFIGVNTGGNQTGAIFNVAVGSNAMSSLSGGGGQNTTVGLNSMYELTSGAINTAVGCNAGRGNTTGSYNVFIGDAAGRNTAAGAQITAASNSVFVGQDARPSGNAESNQIVIGYQGRGNGSNTTTIGNSSTTGTWINGDLIVTGNDISGSGNNSSNRLTFGGSNPGLAIADSGTYAMRMDIAATVGRIGSTNATDVSLMANSVGRVNLYAGDGNVGIVNGNVRMLTAGTGIDFSATSNSGGTMTSELLSDYEEGTWTPTITFGGASVAMTYTTQAGTYTKIGRTVHIYCRVTLSAKGTSTGSAEVRGFPFTAKSNEYPYTAISPGNVTYVGTPYIYVSGGATTANFAQITEAGAFGTLSHANFANNSDVIFMATYFV